MNGGVDTGLEKIIAAETILSDVDGEGGRLIIRGWPVETLSRSARFEDAALLLWQGFFDDLPDAEGLKAALGAARVRAFAHLPEIPIEADLTVALRASLATVQDGEGLETAIALAGSTIVFAASAARRAAGLDPIAPNSTLSMAADFLRMLRGSEADAAEIRALDSYLVTVCDHGLNASTFAARVIASTRAGLVSAVLGGISALKGPLHGGAPGPVLDMLDAIGAAENAENWIEAALARGDRLMGFGHRVYRVRDPRADALKRAMATLPMRSGRLQLADLIEREALTRLAAKYPTRRLETNVEYATALLLEALLIPRGLFTATFACGRILGWIAHAKEQIATGRLVRPRSVYRGPPPRAMA
jgi:citrate synthase